MDDTFRFEYDNEIVQKKLVNSAKKESFDEGFDAGVQKGIQEGIEQGVQEEKIRTIKAMFDNDVSLDVIADVNNLPIDEVKEILELEK